jgi:hypothetical protein
MHESTSRLCCVCFRLPRGGANRERNGRPTNGTPRSRQKGQRTAAAAAGPHRTHARGEEREEGGGSASGAWCAGWRRRASVRVCVLLCFCAFQRPVGWTAGPSKRSRPGPSSTARGTLAQRRRMICATRALPPSSLLSCGPLLAHPRSSRARARCSAWGGTPRRALVAHALKAKRPAHTKNAWGRLGDANRTMLLTPASFVHRMPSFPLPLTPPPPIPALATWLRVICKKKPAESLKPHKYIDPSSKLPFRLILAQSRWVIPLQT